VDDSGRYRAANDMLDLVPPEPTDADRAASVDLTKQPIEKLFRLLAYELMREEKRPPESQFGIRDFQMITGAPCIEQLAFIAQQANDVAEEVRVYHLNVTSTAGLYWLFHKYPEEHSWVWLMSISHDRVLRKIEHHLSKLAALTVDDKAHCIPMNFRTVFMNAVLTWKKLHGDFIALLWNGVAFGVLGDVTSWREIDEENETAADGPGGPPPNVSWSENIIFGNMWISSVERWLQHYSREVVQAAYSELGALQAGLDTHQGESAWRQTVDGVISPTDFMYKQVFGGWELDKGLLRGMLRHALQPTYEENEYVSVGDFGAGGGHYSEWLNDTGLVKAFAFDATRVVSDITGGAVQEVNFASQVKLWRQFDWGLCLDVAAHIPRGHAASLLNNVKTHVSRGLVISAVADKRETAEGGQLVDSNFVTLVEKETGFVLDADMTKSLRHSSDLTRFKETAAVFVSPAWKV